MIHSLGQGLLAAIGLGEGLVVGLALTAFLVLVDVVPRAAQASGTRGLVPLYEMAIVIGSFVGSLTLWWHGVIKVPWAWVAAVGLLFGVFTGLFTASLAEVLNVLPVMHRRLRIKNLLFWLVVALIAGKTLGSLFYWFFPSISFPGGY